MPPYYKYCHSGILNIEICSVTSALKLAAFMHDYRKKLKLDDGPNLYTRTIAMYRSVEVCLKKRVWLLRQNRKNIIGAYSPGSGRSHELKCMQKTLKK